jgi:alkanesulfonate monooxygenase
MDPKPLRFHWRLPYGRELSGITPSRFPPAPIEDGQPDLETQTEFCCRAEQCGIDSVLTDFGNSKPDPMLLAVVLGQVTRWLKFLLAYRSGLSAPTLFVQQLNTLSSLIRGRVALNIVAGYSPEEQRAYGDHLAHDDRYERTEEFLAICRAFWRNDGPVDYRGRHYKVDKGSLTAAFVARDRTFPEIVIGGESPQARDLACRQGTCWMRLADAPERLKDVAALVHQGTEVGIRMGIVARRTRQEALDVAAAMGAGRGTARHFMGEKEWLTPTLWAGAARVYGPAAITLVGSAREVAEALMVYKALGISQFILSGWPPLDEMVHFGENVLPIVREMEARRRYLAVSGRAARR